MCAIAGFYCYGDARPSIETLKGLMLASQTRGKSACGIAYMNAKNEIMIRKQEGPAENLVTGMTQDQWAEVARSPRALLHARATTKGSEKDNVNNHPVSKYGWTVVHNGHINNDDELFSYYKATRYAAVDTAAVPLVLSQGKDYDDSLRHLSILDGNASLAVWANDYPDKIALARLGTNDVYLFLDPASNIMYWCSTPLGGRAIPGFRLGNMAFFTVGKLHENKILVLEPGDQKARLLKVGRRPFLVQKRYEYSPPFTITPLGGETIGASRAGNQETPTMAGGNSPLDRLGLRNRVKGVTHGKDSRRFEWAQPNEKWRGKPAIDTSGIQPSWFKWTDMVQHFQKEAITHGKAQSVATIYTAYGRWVFNCANTEVPGIFATTFLPARRIKKYWRRNFDEQIPDTKLPVVLGKLDHVITLEEFIFSEATKGAVPGFVHYMGYMCPWCGIIMSTLDWSNLLYRCPCCGIVSDPLGKGV